MTQMLREALAEVSRLSEPDQDAIAKMILDELADKAEFIRKATSSKP